MNCTLNYFELEVLAKHPHKFMSHEYNGATNTTFAVDTLYECQQSFVWKSLHSSHIWEDGCVIKDRNGIFSNLAAQQTFTSSGNPFLKWTFVPPLLESIPIHIDIKLESSADKCGCGSESVGASKHSDYCKLYNKGIS